MARKSRLLEVMAEHAEEDDRGRINVVLPDEVRRDRDLMRRLHHRVVDLLADKGILECFADDVEERLASLGAEIVSDFVARLLKEGRTART